MKTTWLPLAVALAIGLPLAARAVDAPHDGSFTSGSCLNCHQMHNATGGTLTNQPLQADMCRTCHNAAGRSARTNWVDADQAVPGTSGDQHRWDALATGHGATIPTHAGMAARVPGGRITCSTCHDVHKANLFNDTNTVHSNFRFGQPTALTSGASAGQLTLTALQTPRPVARGYRVKVVAGNGVILSHDAALGAAATWLNWSGSAWVAGVDNGTGHPITGTFALDDAAVSISITGSVTAGDYWDFYVTYPFVRVPVTASDPPDVMCLKCHGDRDQRHLDVEGNSSAYGWGLGASPMSHPVNQGLRANLRTYDRLTPLDANGGVQGTSGPTGADGVVTNDLVLTGGVVSCVSCHAPHSADSNSLTEDPR